MANDRVYLRCGECHPPGIPRAGSDEACLIKVWGVDPKPLDCGPGGKTALTELERFCIGHATCGHRGFYLADELGRPLPGLAIPEGQNRWYPPPFREEP
jgi:hypothetical protein